MKTNFKKKLKYADFKVIKGLSFVNVNLFLKISNQIEDEGWLYGQMQRKWDDFSLMLPLSPSDHSL